MTKQHTIGLAAITAVFLLFTAYYTHTLLTETGGIWAAPLDDAWIHIQFAHNLSQGHGFSYNPGQPTPGSTAPLWTLLLVPIGWFTTDYMLPALALSAFFLLLSGWLAYGFTYSLSHSWWTALAAGLATVTTGRLLWAGLAGMETTLFAALSLAAVWAYTRWGIRPLSVLLFALASQVRPEGHALFALAGLDAAWHWWQSKQWQAEKWWGIRPFLIALGLYGLVAAPYALFSLATTGQPLANTFYAKVGSEYFFSWRAFRETISFHWQDNPVSFLLLPVGLTAVWQRSRLAAMWLVGLLLLTPIIVDLIWHHGRYTLPLIPLQLVVAALGLHWLVGKIPPAKVSQPALITVAVALFLLGGLLAVPRWATMLGNNAREILEVDVAAAEWLVANTPPDALIAVDDIGAIGFISQRQLFDLNGLISPEMWPILTTEPRGHWRSEAEARLLSEIGPDYLVVFPEWHWELATNPVIMEEQAQFWATTKTMIGEQRAVVYRVRYWPYLETAVPDHPTEAAFADSIALLGYDLDVGDQLRIDFYWRSLQPLTESYDIFIHILDENNQIVAQADTPPVGGLAPTNRWQPGDIVRDQHTIQRPADLPPGTYTLRLGFFLRETGQRLPAVAPDVEADSVKITLFSW